MLLFLTSLNLCESFCLKTRNPSKLALLNVFLSDRAALHHLTFEDNQPIPASGQDVGSSAQLAHDGC